VSVRRRTPLGTQPPEPAEAPEVDVSGTIEIDEERLDYALAAYRKSLPPDQEHAVIVQIEDDWLERLDLPPE